MKERMTLASKNEAQILSCPMAFDCPKDWIELTPTAVEDVRHCNTCQKEVTFFAHPDYFLDLVMEGVCIAYRSKDLVSLDASQIRVGIPRRKGDDANNK